MTGSGAKHLGRAGDPLCTGGSGELDRLESHVRGNRNGDRAGWTGCEDYLFQRDKRTGELQVADMRMNGSCAGGTGAFVDEIASLLKTPVEEFDALAAQGTTVYDISGRCGVYAKTDIQPLLNQGKNQIWRFPPSMRLLNRRSAVWHRDFRSRSRLSLRAVLTFNRTLVRVFAERLDLRPENFKSGPAGTPDCLRCGACGSEAFRRKRRSPRQTDC